MFSGFNIIKNRKNVPLIERFGFKNMIGTDGAIGTEHW